MPCPLCRATPSPPASTWKPTSSTPEQMVVDQPVLANFPAGMEARFVVVKAVSAANPLSSCQLYHSHRPHAVFRSLSYLRLDGLGPVSLPLRCPLDGRQFDGCSLDSTRVEHRGFLASRRSRVAAFDQWRTVLYPIDHDGCDDSRLQRQVP